MTSRRAQRRDGHRRDRRDPNYWTIRSDAEYTAALLAWMGSGPFRAVEPPARGFHEPVDSGAE